MRRFRLALAVALALAAAALVALSTVDYASLKAHIDVFTLDRDADVTPEEYDDVVLRLRAFAGVLAVLAAALAAAGSRLDPVAAAVLRDWTSSLRTAPRACGRWVRAQKPSHLVALLTILATTVVLRAAFLDVPMRYDEAATYNAYVAQPLYIGLSNYSAPNNHLLHTFLANVSVEAFGNHPWAIRLPAFLAGIALIPLTFALGRVLYGPAAAIVASALVAASSTLVEYSTNARGYTLVAALLLCAFLAGAKALERNAAGAWAAMAVACALALYAVPVAVYGVAGVFLWVLATHVLHGRPAVALVRPFVGCLAFCAVVTGVLYGPVFAASGVGSVTSNYFVEPLPLGEFARELPGHLWDTVDSWRRDLPLAVSVALGLGTVLGLVAQLRSTRYPLQPFLAVVLAALPLLCLQRVVPFTRVWLFLVPLAALSAASFFALLLARARRPRWAPEAVAVVFALVASGLVLHAGSVRTSRETGALLDAPAVADYLRSLLEPGDTILALGSEAILEYYLEREGLDASELIWSGRIGRRVLVVVSTLGTKQTLARVLAELPADVRLGRPRLLRRWPSASVYVVRVVA